MTATSRTTPVNNFYGENFTELASDRNIGLLVKQAHFLMRRLIDTKVNHLGLTANQWQPLILVHYRQVNTPAELAKCMQVDTAAITRTITRLEQKGFLRRHKSPHDKRQTEIILTAAGTALSQQILPIIAESLNQQLHGFTHSEIDVLLNMLKRMINNGEQQIGLIQDKAQNQK